MMKTGTTFIRFLRSSPAVPALLAAALTALAGCGEAPPTDLSLPSKDGEGKGQGTLGTAGIAALK